MFFSGLETEINGQGNPLRWPHDTLYPQKLALTSPKSGSRSVSIVHLRTKAMEFSFFSLVSWTFLEGTKKIQKNVCQDR
jgi:hypothetical protein